MSTNNEVTDEALERLRRGDRSAFTALVREHHRRLVAVARSVLGNDDAEEVVQNAWTKAYTGIARFEGRAGIKTWLTRIVINEAKMYLRSRRREVLFDGDVDAGHDPLAARFTEAGRWLQPPARWSVDTPDGLLMEQDMADCLDRTLTAMPPNQRALLEMRDVMQLPFDEICNTLEVSASNARVLLHRARAHIFNLVDHYQETGEC